jgi:hypothetical protein
VRGNRPYVDAETRSDGCRWRGNGEMNGLKEGREIRCVEVREKTVRNIAQRLTGKGA